ncbi:MAG: carbon-nitrogen hydrolase family protein [Armatimonadota bacterium]|nr:carbon-nitrogen hydrolase family protein [Armatimonadota bacterium]
MNVHGTMAALVAMSVCAAAHAEVIFHEDFEDGPAENLLRHSWGEQAGEVLANGAEAGIGVDGSAGAHLHFTWGEDTGKGQGYWQYDLAEAMPLVEGLESISFRVRGNVPVALKVSIGTFGFIYHAPRSSGSGEWETVTLDSAWEELAEWCRGGDEDPHAGLITGIIFAVQRVGEEPPDVVIDDLVFTAAEGTGEVIERERFAREMARVRVSVATQEWSDEGRTLQVVQRLIDEAAWDGADILLLPMECVKTEGEPIPGPISEAIAARAGEHSMYVIGNIRERDGESTYVTSFLCGRDGQIIGTYRKSHKMPDEDMDLGDDLPVFDTDLGTIAMRIGSDRRFADIDHVYAAKGARMIFWSQKPEPVEDEHLQDFPVRGRALDYRLFYACARYARAGPGWITNKFPPYRGQPIGRSWVINREGQRIACTVRKGAGVATAIIPKGQLRGSGRGASGKAAFSAITDPVALPQPREWGKRRVRLTAIENHIGFEDLLAKLDEAGEMRSDLVVTYEYVWIPIRGGGEESDEAVNSAEDEAHRRLRLVAEKADRWDMYVLIAGVIERQEVNEGILFDREGNEVGRYRKIVSTYDLQQCGTATPILETDFGRIGVHICADEAYPEIDRCYGIKGADIICVPTQSWGPDALHRDMRDLARIMDAGTFLVEATHSCSEARHRSIIADPTGAIVSASAYMRPGLVTAVVDLDNDRPRRYVRDWSPHEPHGYLPQYQPTELPRVENDLRETILRQRRPELYQVLAPEKPEGTD